MKFTGQVRVPEIDHPGVPATILVEDDQVEVFLEGESLGRWSLYDVEASRLVSAAFSLSLDHEEITFIADEPVDFAYKGVDHMAEVWARYKSMTMPRRMVAVGKSRRGTVQSRISELRSAMLQNLDTVGRGVPRLAPIETVGRAPVVPVAEAAPVPPGETPEPAVAREPRPVFRPAPVEETIPPPVEEVAVPPPTKPFEEALHPVASPTPRLRPGAGLYARRVDRSTEEREEPAPIFAPPETTEPIFGSPWDEPAGEPQPVATPFQAPQPERVVESPPEPMPEPPLVPALEPSPVFAAPDAPVPEPEERAPALDDEPEAVIPAAATVVPELVKELLGTSSDEGGEEGARDLVVDLGHYEGGSGRQGAPVDEPPPAPSKEPVLAGAPVEPERGGGLLGAVRSAFARNKVAHEHEFVEAPGGIGIVRQICAECGYISIGVSD